MEALITIFENITSHIILEYSLFVVFLAYALKGLFGDLLGYLRVPDKYKKTLAVFIISTIAALIWHYYLGADLVKLFVSYSASTTIYEVFLKYVTDKLKKKPNE